MGRITEQRTSHKIVCPYCDAVNQWEPDRKRRRCVECGKELFFEQSQTNAAGYRVYTKEPVQQQSSSHSDAKKAVPQQNVRDNQPPGCQTMLILTAVTFVAVYIAHWLCRKFDWDGFSTLSCTIFFVGLPFLFGTILNLGSVFLILFDEPIAKLRNSGYKVWAFLFELIGILLSIFLPIGSLILFWFFLDNH